MALTLARALAIGLALGILTGIPLGVVNVSVIELAGRDRRAATWLGFGGALADTVHATLAIVGYGALIEASRTATRVLAVVSAIVVGAYAVWIVRRPARERAQVERAAPRSRWLALGTGVSLTLPNPGALMAWTAVAAALFPGASIGVAAAAAGGVGLGSAIWFAVLARIAERVTVREQRWAARAVAVVLLGLAVVAVVRAIG